MNDDFGAMLLQSAKQALAIAQGEMPPSREFFYLDVKQIRAKTGLTQHEFVKKLAISPKTLQNWEQGTRQPTGATKTLLRWLDKNPKLIDL